jgi:hypothetical protein
LYKKGTLHHKKGHFSSQKKGTFSPLKKFGPPPPVPTPLNSVIALILNYINPFTLALGFF